MTWEQRPHLRATAAQKVRLTDTPVVDQANVAMGNLFYLTTFNGEEWAVSSIEVDSSRDLKELKRLLIEANEWCEGEKVSFRRFDDKKQLALTTMLSEVLPNSKENPLAVIVSLSPPPPPPDIERLLPLISVLPAVIKEAGISRKTRLNPWERESMRTSGSKRSKRFRKKVIEYYKRGSNSGKKVRCQILNGYIFNADAEDEATGIIAAHIWKASTRGHGLQDFGLSPQEVNSARNGLFLTKGLEEAFDYMQICFLFNLIESRIVLWVADTSLMNKTIAGSGKTTSDGSDILFSAVHQKPLHCPPNCFPYRRLLSWHARLTLELRPQTIDSNQFASEYDNSPGREKEAIDPFTRAVHEMVEPGDDASN